MVVKRFYRLKEQSQTSKEKISDPLPGGVFRQSQFVWKMEGGGSEGLLLLSLHYGYKLLEPGTWVAASFYVFTLSSLWVSSSVQEQESQRLNSQGLVNVHFLCPPTCKGSPLCCR